MNLIGNSNLCPALSPDERNVIKFHEGVKIKDLAKVVMADPLTDAVSKAYLNIGQSSESKTLTVLVATLACELKDCFTTYSIEEICHAIDLGSKGKLNELKDLIQPVISVMNILKWVHLYDDKIRKEAIHKQNKHLEKLAKELTEKEKQEKIEAFKEEICLVYESYCDAFGELPEGLSMGLKASYCRYLYEKNIIELTAEQEREIFDKAKSLMPTEAQIRGMNAVDRVFHNKKKEAQIQEIAESIALEYLFTEYLKQGIDLKEKLNENKPQ